LLAQQQILFGFFFQLLFCNLRETLIEINATIVKIRLKKKNDVRKHGIGNENFKGNKGQSIILVWTI
jgi:hypothetical protein